MRTHEHQRCYRPGSCRRRACGGGSPCSAVRSCCSCGSSCVTSRLSLVPGMCRSIRMVFSGMVPSPGFQSRFFVLANERTVRRTRGHAFHVRIENPKRARIRTLSVFIPELRYLQFNSASGINEIKSKTLHSPNHPQQEIHQSIHQLEGCNTARATLRSSD